jgi:hypothetical protein
MRATRHLEIVGEGPRSVLLEIQARLAALIGLEPA